MLSKRFILQFAYLICLAAVCLFLADRSWKSISDYRSEYTLEQDFQSGPVLTDRLVVFVLDGMRVDRALELSAWNTIADNGASGSVQVVQPSLSNPARATLATGALPEIHGVTNNALLSPPQVQSIFSLADRQGTRTRVYGSGFWKVAFGEYIGKDFRGFGQKLKAGKPSEQIVLWQQDSCKEAMEHLVGSDAQLLLAGLVAGDEAGHDYGGLSEAYKLATSEVDNCMGQLLSSLDGPNTTFLAVSDHGHIDRYGKGGHGGSEPEVILAPFAMSGKGIRSAKGLEGQLADLTPTISILLGLPIPANNQGKVMWEALDFPEDLKAAGQVREKQQQQTMEAHLPNRDKAFAKEKNARKLPVMIAVCWFLVVFIVVLWKQRLLQLAFSLAAFFVTYYMFFYVFELWYSLSAIVREEYMNGFLVRNVVAAILAFVLASICLTGLGGRKQSIYLRLALALCSVFGILVAITHYSHGLLMVGWMPELVPLFKAYLDMLAILGIVMGTTLVLLVNHFLPHKELESR